MDKKSDPSETFYTLKDLGSRENDEEFTVQLAGQTFGVWAIDFAKKHFPDEPAVFLARALEVYSSRAGEARCERIGLALLKVGAVHRMEDLDVYIEEKTVEVNQLMENNILRSFGLPAARIAALISDPQEQQAFIEALDDRFLSIRKNYDFRMYRTNYILEILGRRPGISDEDLHQALAGTPLRTPTGLQLELRRPIGRDYSPVKPPIPSSQRPRRKTDSLPKATFESEASTQPLRLIPLQPPSEELPEAEAEIRTIHIGERTLPITAIETHTGPVRWLRGLVERYGKEQIQQALDDLTKGRMSEKNNFIVSAYLGLGDGPPVSAEELAKQLGLKRHNIHGRIRKVAGYLQAGGYFDDENNTEPYQEAS